MDESRLFNFVLFFLGIFGSCIGGGLLEDLNSAVASFTIASLEELSGIEDSFEPIDGTITFSSTTTLISMTGSLRELQVSGVGGISNVTAKVNLGAMGTETDPHLIISMDIISPTIKGTHNIRGHIGNSISLGNNTFSNTWTVTLSPNFPFAISCHPKISVESGYVRLGQCVPRTELDRQNALIEFPGLVNDSRVDPDMLEDLNGIILGRAVTLGLNNRFGQGLLQKIMIHLQRKFNQVRLLDIFIINSTRNINIRPAELRPFALFGLNHVTNNVMTERMKEYAAQIISNFTKIAPNPSGYSSSIAIDSPLVRLSGSLSNISLAIFDRDFQFSVTTSASVTGFHQIYVSIDVSNAELTGEYNLEGCIANETQFNGQGSWSIKNISINRYFFEPRLELNGIYFKERSTLMGDFMMSVERSELQMPGLLDNVDVIEEVKHAVMEIIHPQIISLINNKLSAIMQRLVANELIKKFGAIPAVEIITRPCQYNGQILYRLAKILIKK